VIIDTNRNTFTRLPALKAAGVTTIIRYIAAGLTGEEKVIKPGEARAIAEAGMRLGLVYEIGGKPSGAQVGQRDGTFAHSYAPTVGAPDGAMIWYTVDYDAGPNDMPGIIEAFKAFKSAVSPKFRVGCYGSGYVCSKLKAAGLIDGRWLTDSLGFSGTHSALAAGEYEMVQALPKNVAGMDADANTLRQPGIDIGDFVPFASVAVAQTPADAAPKLPVALPALDTHAMYGEIIAASGAIKAAAVALDEAQQSLNAIVQELNKTVPPVS
jgi:hypothetical protein